MLNPWPYRQSMRQLGERFRWLKAVQVDAYDLSSGIYAAGAYVDVDHGVVYIDRGEYTGIVTQHKSRVLTPELGWTSVEELRLTTMPDEVLLSPQDCIVLQRRTLAVQQKVTRGTGTTDDLGMTYPTKLSFVAQATTQYHVGKDCILDATGKTVVWQAGQAAPTAGTVYMAEYTCRPIYMYMPTDTTLSRPLATGGESLSPVTGKLELKAAHG